MLTQADIPSDLTDTYKDLVFQFFDAELNSSILYVLLHGIYTGILAVTLWNIFINKCWPIRRALVIVIVLLHALITISVAADWSSTSSAFIKNSENFWIVYLQLNNVDQASLEVGIVASLSTILADLYMIWCCWMVWGRRWLVVLFPILSLISATVSKIFEVHNFYTNVPLRVFPVFYVCLILATTLWCTLIIICRILIVARVRHGAEGRLRVYRHFIEVLVESSALYSISVIVYLAFAFHGGFAHLYLDKTSSIVKGVAPTLLIGRAAAGHTRPRDDCDESTVSSLHFQTPSEVDTTSFQESTTESAVVEIDIEAQQQQLDELVVDVERI